MDTPPHVSKEHGKIHEKYIEYYNKYFPGFAVETGNSWLDFLQNNYDKFPKVHSCEELIQFARLTHSIGNVAVVPKKFNTPRSDVHFDYWDLSLLTLQKVKNNEKIDPGFKDGINHLENFMSSFDSWETFIDYYCLNDYVDANYNVIPFWDEHFESKIPLNREDIISFLSKVNYNIKSRGEKMINRIVRKP